VKLFKNTAFQSVKAESIKNMDDLIVIIDSLSKNYKSLLCYSFHQFKKVEDGIWKGYFQTASTIASKNHCCDKTVYRFTNDLSCLIFRKKRWKDGKQTSNTYKMHKTAYQFLKAFWRLGLFKVGVDFEERWSWIKKMWLDCGSDTLKFMNKVWNYKPLKPKNKRTTYEHEQKKMSVGDNGKCPSTSYSLTLTLEDCTTWVPSKDLKNIERLLNKKLHAAIGDIKWLALEQGRKITSYSGLLAERLASHLRPKKV